MDFVILFFVMKERLLIDEGNTFTKFELWRNNVKAGYVVCEHTDVKDECNKLGVSLPVDEAIICSVRGEHSVSIGLARKTVIVNCNTPMPLKIKYAHTLGADRIAAAAGALALAPGKKCLVIDFGTAITYDIVTAEGEFIGGNIAPGIFMRSQALNQFTKALPKIELSGETPAWGFNTDTAIRSGAVLGAVGELEYYIRSASKGESDLAVILTGGQAELVIPHIEYPIIHEPNLVLMGLNSIINYNEDK